VNKPENREDSRGYTLIELMIALAVLAIVTAVAVSSYRQHVIKTRRAAAESCLLEYAQGMERNRMSALRYDTTPGGNDYELPTLDCSQQLYGYYGFAFADEEPTRTTFEIIAKPGSKQADRTCGALAYDEQGHKQVIGAGSVDKCWK